MLNEGLPDVAIVARGVPPDDDTLAFLAVAALVTDRKFAIIALCSTRQRLSHRVDASLVKPVATGELVDTVLVTAHCRRATLGRA